MTTTPSSGLFDSLLRRPKETSIGLAAEPAWRPTLTLLGAALGSMAVFGFVLGLFSGATQLWAAPLKTTLGLAFTALICFPSLCILGALSGSEATVRGYVGVLAGGLALCGMLLLGFAPVLWVFSQSTQSVGFFGFLALGIWFVSMLVGLHFILRGVRGMTLRGVFPMLLWSGVFLLVAFQMTSSLRPIIGKGPTLLPTEKRFFIEHWFHTLHADDQDNQSPADTTPTARTGESHAAPATTPKPAESNGATTPAGQPASSPWKNE